MTSVLFDRVTKLRGEAKDDRNNKRFDLAVGKLRQAIDDLEEELDAIQRGQSQEDKCSILKPLSEAWGQLGGTLRDERKLDAARESYEHGNRYEDERRLHCNAKDTYNLLQHEVIRLLIDPSLIDSKDFLARMEFVRSVIQGQVNSGRDDSWALADLILAQFLCDADADSVLADLEKRQAEKTFYKSAYDVVIALIAEGLGRGNPLEERLEAFRRLLQRKGGFA